MQPQISKMARLNLDCLQNVCLQFIKFWFRSSVGLEQQPSKLWVLGSNPNGITF